MKRILIFCLLCIVCAGSMFAQNTYVLVTGVSNYQNEEVNLAQTTKDAKSFAEVMKTQTPNVTLLTSRYANHDNILEKLRALCNRASAQDRIIFYFSGHGGPGHICASDKNISYRELMEVLQKSQAGEKICFIDACHAGTMANEVTETAGNNSWENSVGNSGLIFYMGCRSNEFSVENSWVGAGFFTQALLKGIQGKADSDLNKEVTVMELFRYIHADVTSRSSSSQHPQLLASPDAYNLVVARWN